MGLGRWAGSFHTVHFLEQETEPLEEVACLRLPIESMAEPGWNPGSHHVFLFFQAQSSAQRWE